MLLFICKYSKNHLIEVKVRNRNKYISHVIHNIIKYGRWQTTCTSAIPSCTTCPTCATACTSYPTYSTSCITNNSSHPANSASSCATIELVRIILSVDKLLVWQVMWLYQVCGKVILTNISTSHRWHHWLCNEWQLVPKCVASN